MVRSAFGLGIPGGVYSACALGVVLLALAVWSIRRTLAAARPSGRRRAALIGARAVTAAVAWLVAVQPQWVEERFEEEPGALAVLVDVSRSMALPSGTSRERSRRERTAALLSRWRDEADRSVGVFTFGGRLEGAELSSLADELPADADQSRLGPALGTLFGGGASGDEVGDVARLGAVVVISDGAESGGLDPEAIARAGVPVHAVAIGEEALRDDAIAEIEADPVGFLRRPARVRVVLRAHGGSRRRVPVTLRRGDELEREVVAELPADGEVEVDIPFTPRRLGREVYRVSIPTDPDDAVPANNERAFLVRVTRDKLRVLLVAGQPSWDQRFLRQFLQQDPATDLISFFILRNTSDLTMAGPDELALIPFPTDELFNEHLGSFDLVVFQNFEYGPYQMASYLPRIRDYVVRGGSFAMIGGPLSFHDGGYAGTPIAEILPVELPPAGAGGAQTVTLGRFAPRLVPELAGHPLVELLPDPAANLEAWSRLAPLEGVNVVPSVREGALRILEHPTARSAVGPLPVLVAGTAGEGRTLALTTDTTWRWGITTGGATGDASAYERFWDRAVRWLARDPSLEPARVVTDRPRYGAGATAVVEVRLRDQRYVPYGERDLAVELRRAGEGEALAEVAARTDVAGRASARVTVPNEPGAYRLAARLRGEDEPLAEEWLVVETGGDELADPRARPETLRALAAATGGQFYADEGAAPRLGDVNSARTRSLGVAEVALLAGPLGFLLVLLPFVLEWVLRRRYGVA